MIRLVARRFAKKGHFMRDFFWFAVLTIAMAIGGDYNSTMKTVTIVSRDRAPAESIAAQAGPLILAADLHFDTLVP